MSTPKRAAKLSRYQTRNKDLPHIPVRVRNRYHQALLDRVFAEEAAKETKTQGEHRGE